MKILIAGAGIAGLTAALRVDALGHDVEVLVKGVLGEGCTAHAQGVEPPNQVDRVELRDDDRGDTRRVPSGFTGGVRHRDLHGPEP